MQSADRPYGVNWFAYVQKSNEVASQAPVNAMASERANVSSLACDGGRTDATNRAMSTTVATPKPHASRWS